MKFEMDKMVKKSEELVKKGEGMAKDMIPKVKDATSDLKESLANIMDKGSQSAQQLFEKKDSVKEDAVSFAKNSSKEVSNKLDSRNGKKNTGKIVAGVAVAAAAAAAYALYKKNKIKNENLKKEYSEKLTRWAELDLDEIESETDGFMEPMKVTPKKVYKAGTNAVIDDIVVNISNPSSDFTFNPDEDGEPVADLDLKKAVMEKTEAVREKLRTKIEEGKLQTKLGSMEAKDKYVEIKDLAEDKIEAAKSKVDQEIAPNVKRKAADLKSEAEEKLEGFKKQNDVNEVVEEVQEEIRDKSDEAKKKFEDLKSKVASTADEMEEKTDGFMKNDMAFDDEDAFEPENDNFVDEPFGAQEIIDDVEENAEGLKDKMKHLAENAKAKIMPEKPDVDEKEELVEYKVTVHNRGSEDYSFNPMQLQLFDIAKRSVHIMAKHEDGTTLGRVTVKPGETYTGKLFVKIAKEKKHGILFFKDLSLDYSVLFLTEDESPVEKDPSLVLDEDYLYSDKEVLEEHVDYKRL